MCLKLLANCFFTPGVTPGVDREGRVAAVCGRNVPVCFTAQKNNSQTFHVPGGRCELGDLGYDLTPKGE